MKLGGGGVQVTLVYERCNALIFNNSNICRVYYFGYSKCIFVLVALIKA